MWEIIDSKGVVYSGDESEMTEKFAEIQHAQLPEEEQEYDTSEFKDLKWSVDLKLVQIHEIYN